MIDEKAAFWRRVYNHNYMLLKSYEERGNFKLGRKYVFQSDYPLHYSSSGLPQLLLVWVRRNETHATQNKQPPPHLKKKHILTSLQFETQLCICDLILKTIKLYICINSDAAASEGQAVPAPPHPLW